MVLHSWDEQCRDLCIKSKNAIVEWKKEKNSIIPSTNLASFIQASYMRMYLKVRDKDKEMTKKCSTYEGTVDTFHKMLIDNYKKIPYECTKYLTYVLTRSGMGNRTSSGNGVFKFPWKISLMDKKTVK